MFLIRLRMLLQQRVLLGVVLHVLGDQLRVFLIRLRMLLQQRVLLGIVLHILGNQLVLPGIVLLTGGKPCVLFSILLGMLVTFTRKCF